MFEEQNSGRGGEATTSERREAQTLPLEPGSEVSPLTEIDFLSWKKTYLEFRARREKCPGSCMPVAILVTGLLPSLSHACRAGGS